jgi:predicted methyltransferase
MNKAIHAALEPGGLYVILDHSAKDGAGVTEVKNLHRIEEKVVVEEITRAGFELARKGDFLRNPADPRDGNVFGPLRGKTDRFVLVFRKK